MRAKKMNADISEIDLFICDILLLLLALLLCTLFHSLDMTPLLNSIMPNGY